MFSAYFLTKRLHSVLYILLILLHSHICLAKNATRQIIIDHSTIYENMTFDLGESTFLIENNATLTFLNCNIKAIISSNNPVLFTLNNGNIHLENNIISIDASTITANPNSVSPYVVLKNIRGNINLIHNQFSVNLPYRIGILTTGTNQTSDFNIRDNHLYQFHGGFFLRNSWNSQIVKNQFTKVSGSNIYIDSGVNTNIQENILLFSGNNNVGDAIDVTDSDVTNITKNYILNDSCYSIMILRSKNILLSDNNIVGGITYAINILPSLSATSLNNKYLLSIKPNPVTFQEYPNSNITITHNYLSQNRFGLTATSVQNMDVKNNTFIQKFNSDSDRQFWTNNDILLKGVSGLHWENNLYKEAYTQTNTSNNTLASKFVIFPEHGGVIL